MNCNQSATGVEKRENFSQPTWDRGPGTGAGGQVAFPQVRWGFMGMRAWGASRVDLGLTFIYLDMLSPNTSAHMSELGVCINKLAKCKYLKHIKIVVEPIWRC